MDPIDPKRLDLAREYLANPAGPHSTDLQKLLRILRWDQPLRQFVALQPRTGGPWYLARMNGPKGTPLSVYTECPLPGYGAASWAIFRARWLERTGERLVLEEDQLPDPLLTEPVSSEELVAPRLLGYSDRFDVHAGERIEFKVSAAEGSPVRTRLVRLRCGDEANIGFRCEEAEGGVAGTFQGRSQPIHAGSFIDGPAVEADVSRGWSVHLFCWPTLPRHGDEGVMGEQVLFGNWLEDTASGFAIFITAQGTLGARLGDGATVVEVTLTDALLERQWYSVALSVEAETGEVTLAQRLHEAMRPEPAVSSGQASAPANFQVDFSAPVRAAASSRSKAVTDHFGRLVATALYNGKLEAPALAPRPMTADEWSRFERGEFAGFETTECLLAWDFSLEMSGTRVVDVSGRGRHAETVNLPTRAMKGVHWDGSEYNFQHRPAHYGAIHFHDDDLYDCGWATDTAWDVPAEQPSGLYALMLEQTVGEDAGVTQEDCIPFVVSPPVGTARARLALLLPSAAYWAYANRHTLIAFAGREQVRNGFTTGDATSLYLHHHPELGLSTYDNHSDGSGVCYSSRLRPVLSLRPKEALWQLPADTHIIDWLDARGIEYDVISEDALDREGLALLSPYACVMTGTHPEYPSKTMIDAYAAYQRQGGRFIYLGGNGFYWRVSYHPELPGVLEMRRSEDGIRAWLAEGGEYYHGFTGELGGMWRRMGHAPQSVAGTGMTAQGFDRSTYYTRTAAGDDPRAAFIFEGVDREERIGDFGLIGGGAAGWEVDRADVSLGTPAHALVVAVADTFSSGYHWMKEELTHTHAAITGDTCPLVRCDMVFYETPGGGAVFSTSSIAWAGALSHDEYDNNVSRITENVIRRFTDPAPF